MAMSRRRRRQRATFIGAAIGLMVIFTFVISLINPDFGTNTNTSDDVTLITPGTAEPTRVIVPTPDPDPQLEGEPVYIHSTGYFQTFRPAGDDWYIDDTPIDDQASRLSLVMQSQERLVVLHNYIQPGVEYESLESLSENFLTAEHYAGEWSRYGSWQETGERQITDNRITINFRLEAEDTPYIGRDVMWLDGTWLYVSRVVVPSNNPALLDTLDQLVISNFIGYHDIQALPRLWPVYTDQQLGFLFKYDPGWQLAAGGVGRPVTFNSTVEATRGTTRVWTVPERLIESPEAAEAWLTETSPNATILGSGTIEREFGSGGYQVSYRFQDDSGDAHSGLVVLLNDDAGTLYIADLHLDAPNLNLLSDENLAPEQMTTRQGLVEGFTILPLEAREPLPVPEVPAEAVTEEVAATESPSE